MPLVKRQYRTSLGLIAGVVLGAFPVLASPGVTFHSETFRDVPFTVAWLDLEKTDLELYWKNPDGAPFTNFARLDAWLATQGKRLIVATNSGIYAEDRTPLGLHVAGGRELRTLNPHKGGKGNFALKPNGVFYVDDGGARIRTTEAYAAASPKPELAVQSGPLLVIDGALHPKFRRESTSIHFRNGIGVASANRVAIAIADLPVNLHTFASFFKERLQCDNALYLDGSLSGLYAPEIDRTAPGLEYVGILAVTTKQAPEESPTGDSHE